MARKEHTMLDLILTNVRIDHVFADVVVGTKRNESIYILNVCRNASKRNQLFRAILQKGIEQAGCSKLLACGDFNAMDQCWGYVKSNAKGRNLAQDALDSGYVLVADPADPTRTGASVF
ncbi:hypothetical protein HPB48_011134 [Haemaphysalis longicornis]|uniref:Endonuclease/exonuclease/phosphatase domain-containing protein n=1 Tax=Haemaphysalis longicornis TaxID=44386 RepID=A0A9J6GIV5_HAELO|nr:hypothetical protein HPB48_011134 [Haemaphysalis longicornis]